jgi:methyl halide transferase
MAQQPRQKLTQHMNQTSQKSIQIDQEGYPMLTGVRVSDEAFGRELLANIFMRDRVAYTKTSDEEVVVEAFDAPLVVLTVHKREGTVWQFQMPFDFMVSSDLKNLRLDEFDRFCGHFDNGVPFVFSRTAQAELFKLVDDFTDDSITVGETTIQIPSKYQREHAVGAPKFWSDMYSSKETPWDLDQPTPLLKQALLQLKLPRQRVLVLGAGRGHDAVEIARAGHFVTAVDFSETAEKEFQEKYGTVKGLTYLVQDAFKLPASFNQQFDLVFDHTFFVAIDPSRRKEAVQLWKRMIAPRGHILGIFFLMDKTLGPAFGSTEWEILEYFRKDFDLIYWTRSKASVEKRRNTELLVYATKKS